MNLRFPQNVRNILTSWVTVSCLRRTALSSVSYLSLPCVYLPLSFSILLLYTAWFTYADELKSKQSPRTRPLVTVVCCKSGRKRRNRELRSDNPTLIPNSSCRNSHHRTGFCFKGVAPKRMQHAPKNCLAPLLCPLSLRTSVSLAKGPPFRQPSVLRHLVCHLQHPAGCDVSPPGGDTVQHRP